MNLLSMNVRGVCRLAGVSFLVATIVLSAGLSKASISWNVTDGNWDTITANWIGDSTTFTDNGTVDVVFSGSGGTITISANMSPLSTTVSAGSGTYTFTGGPIDSGTLTKSGAGTLTLSSVNTYSGKTVISGGTLFFGSIANVGVACSMGNPTTIPNGTIDLYPGVTLKPSVQNPGFSTDRVINLAGSGSGTVTIQSAYNDTRITFTSAFTATGTGARTLALITGSPGSTGDRSYLNINGGIPDMSDAQLSVQINGGTQTESDNAVTFAGTNTFSGPLSISMNTGNGGRMTVTISGSGQLGAGNYANTISIGSRCSMVYASSATQTFSGVISGAGDLTLTGSGPVTLNGNVTASGYLRRQTTSTLTIGPGASASHIDLGTSGSVNATNPLTVTNEVTFGGVMLSMSSGNSFTISGANLLNPTAASNRVITVSTGTLCITPGMADGTIGGASSVYSYFNPRTGVWSLKGTGVGGPDTDNHAWRYIARPTADFDIKAHYTGGGGSWRRVGLMARDSLSQNSGNYAAIWGADNGCQAVGVAGVTTYDQSIPAWSWLEIKKVGNTVTLYNSSDGISYTPRMSTNSVWGPMMYLGLDANYGTISATWDYVNFMGGSTNVPNWSTTEVYLAGTGRLDLNYVGTIVLSALYVNGSLKAPGTYGPTGSGAAFIDDLHFTGTGNVRSVKPLAGFCLTLR